MLYRLLSTLLLSIFLLAVPMAASAAGITNYPQLLTADYWTAKNPTGDKLILTSDGVTAFNTKVRNASRSVPSLLIYPGTVSGDALKTRIMNYQVLEDDLYLHGNKVSEHYKDILRKQTNVSAIPNRVNVRYAVTVRRTPVRNLPTGEGLYYYAGERNFDVLQETSLDPGESVIVLHESANKYFYYVQSVNYSGWVSKFNLGFTDRTPWLQYADPKEFLVVTGANVSLKTGAEQVVYQQGSRMLLDSEQAATYTVEAPTRATNGNLRKEKLLVPKTAQVHKGYLPYTANNIVRSALEFINMPYGWGGQKNSVDCSSLVFNAYRTVGVVLPRDADEQENTAGTKTLLQGLGDSAKTATIKELAPGACLYMDGHVVMYLGNINGVPYVVHSLGSCFVNGQRRVVMKVVVSDLSLQRLNGETFLSELNNAMEFK